MGVYAGPDVSESGLLLALDGANIKSFKGEPTTNLISDPLALSGLPSPLTYNAYEATATRTNSLPNSEMAKISPYWIKLVKTSASNGRCVLHAQSGFTTGVDYCCSFYVYSEDPNATRVQWLSENSSVATIQSYTAYNYSAGIGIRRIQTIFRSVAGSTINALRVNSSAPIGTTFWITGIQFEQKSYPTTVVNGTRGATVATGGGWGDMSSNSRHGTLTNGVRESADGGGSLIFDGVDDYVNIGYDGAGGYLDDGQDRTEITIDCFVKLNALGSDQVFFQVGGYLNSCVLGCLANNKVRFLTRKDGSTVGGAYDAYVDSTTTLVAGQWYHVVGSKASSTMSLYINGVQEASISTSFVWNTGGDTGVWIGRNNTQSSLTGINNKVDELNGLMGMMRVYSRGISANEAMQSFIANRSRFGV
jgi:hypothetical protein